MKTLRMLTILIALLHWSHSAQAASIVNADFSTGLSGWNAQGNVSVAPGGYAVLTSQGSEYATSLFGGTNGSTLSQAVNVSVGSIITFDFNFFTTDYLPFNDFALVLADGTRLVSNVAAVGAYGSSGWQSYSFVATTSFTSLVFVLSNAVDTSYDSTLYIDNVTVTNTPIPAAVWLFGSSLAGLLGMRRRQALTAIPNR